MKDERLWPDDWKQHAEDIVRVTLGLLLSELNSPKSHLVMSEPIGTHVIVLATGRGQTELVLELERRERWNYARHRVEEPCEYRYEWVEPRAWM